MMKSVFLFYVHGRKPNWIDRWSKPYRTLAACRAQVTRWTHETSGEWIGDRRAVIYRLDYHPGAGVPALVALEAVIYRLNYHPGAGVPALVALEIH